MRPLFERRRTDFWGLLHRWTYVRYIGASALALAGDMALFLMLLHTGMAAVSASAIGYGAGIAIHWLISSRIVFSNRTSRLAEVRNRQKMLFIASALAGLGITVGIITLASWFHVDARVAKIGAVIVAFQSTYMLRKTLVFGAQ